MEIHVDLQIHISSYIRKRSLKLIIKNLVNDIWDFIWLKGNNINWLSKDKCNYIMLKLETDNIQYHSRTDRCDITIDSINLTVRWQPIPCLETMTPMIF